MTHQKAVDVLRTERACVETDACPCSHVECKDCMLCMDKDEILAALDMAIDTLAGMIDDGK